MRRFSRLDNFLKPRNTIDIDVPNVTKAEQGKKKGEMELRMPGKQEDGVLIRVGP